MHCNWNSAAVKTVYGKGQKARERFQYRSRRTHLASGGSDDDTRGGCHHGKKAQHQLAAPLGHDRNLEGKVFQ